MCRRRQPRGAHRTARGLPGISESTPPQGARRGRPRSWAFVPASLLFTCASPVFAGAEAADRWGAGRGARNRAGAEGVHSDPWSLGLCVHVCACVKATLSVLECGPRLVKWSVRPSPTEWAGGSLDEKLCWLRGGYRVGPEQGHVDMAHHFAAGKWPQVFLEADPQGWQQFFLLIFGPREPRFTLPEKAVLFGSKNN